MCTVNRSHQRLLVSDGCPIPIGNSVCGETKTLDIINEFKRLYEEKMNEIDNTSCGDCLQEKLQLQQNWIGDLTEQNEMLVRAVEDLELEATERVKMLEEKLQRSAECICEAERRSTEKDSTIQKLEAKVGELNSMTKQFQMKKDECENLQKNMIDMRQALTEEVASKHDTVLKLKRECQELEERCIQADKQTAFRDDIIKELRKEIKQLRQQVTHEEVEKLNNTIEELRNTLQESKTVREKEDQEKCFQMTTLNEEIQRLDSCLCEANEKLKEKDTEIFTLNRAIKELECQYEPTTKTKDKEVIALKYRIEELQSYLFQLKGKLKLCKHCRQSLRVDFCGNSEVQTDASDPDEEQLQKLIQRDELIKFQADTLRMLQQELQRLKEKNKEFVCDRDTNQENCDGICYLEEQVELFKGKLVQSENRVVELTKEIDNKEDIIKSQKDTLNFVEKQLDILRSKESEMRIENEHQCLCIQQLKSRVTELETSTQDAERRANNLQMAVDLYTNTINVLEASEEKFRMEIDRQRTTINNLQEALVSAKNELDNTKQKHDDNVSVGWASRWFGLSETKPTNNNEKPVHDI
ncbi:unnamed protein product [Diabrotica balteata]|uniref:Uncharacterized protein n=1 Tax=Diabrotica balteata TaxID=107213 RepID=A0A9N9T126_DIABA|nr:unnamed protein product [Diabrotica balteata]